MAEREGGGRYPRRLMAWGAGLVVVLLIVWGFWGGGAGLREGVRSLLAWVQGLGPLAPLLFVVVVAVSMLLLLPGMMFTLGGGFLFGPLWGTLYILVGSTAGATVAFLAGRHLLVGPVTRSLERRPRLQGLVAVVEKEGWRIVMFSRMVPMFPFKLSNYVFGVTNIPLRQFVFGTAVGIIPITVTNVYAGSLLASLAALGTEDAPDNPYQWAIYAVGFAVALGFVLYVTRLARKSLQAYDSTGEDVS